jgi:DNA-binding NarL/FixJ family response regulator
MLIERSISLLVGGNAAETHTSLTSRQHEVLEVLVKGRSNKEIGTLLGIEARTVKAHISQLVGKVGVKNRITLSVHAISESLVSAN